MKAKCRVKQTSPNEVAQFLAKGDIIARFGIDQMELVQARQSFIIADPRNLQTLVKINKYVKMRDFWIFAPSILEERMKDYIYNNKNNEADLWQLVLILQP